MLSAWDIEHFRTFGFVVLRRLLHASEVIRLRDEVDEALTDAYGTGYGRNTRDDMPDEADDDVAAAGNFLPLMSVRTPLSLSLVADDGRLWTCAEELLGDVTV